MSVAVFLQPLDPCDSTLASTALAALPVLVLFWLLVIARKPATVAAAAGALAAVLVAVIAFGMPVGMAGLAFLDGAAFGLVPVGWLVFSAMLLYNTSVAGGLFARMRQSVSRVSDD